MRCWRISVVARALHDATGSERLTEAGVSLGTPGYMAPEQLAGDHNIDARADVYAVAVVGYEMLAGAGPFAGATPQAIAAAHCSQAAVAPSSRRPTGDGRCDREGSGEGPRGSVCDGGGVSGRVGE